MDNLEEAKKYYIISADAENSPDINNLSDGGLASLLDKDASRQILHITYGLILSAKNAGGAFIYKDKIYAVLHEYEDDYYDALIEHIGRHIGV